MEMVCGGVTAAKGFVANGLHCGIRKNKTKPDLAMIYSQAPCAAAAVYTQNLVKGAPILVTKRNLENGCAQAVIVNSGNANTCNANGVEIAESMCALASAELNVQAEDVIVASTGVIGQPLPLEPIAAAVPALAKGLSEAGGSAAAQAIMTTDTFAKEAACTFTLEGRTVTVGGMAKGSGMIHPNMATMLGFVTTDCAISAVMLQKAVIEAVNATFNCVSVDGDSSTNDTFAVLANGLAGHTKITEDGDAYDEFVAALTEVCRSLSKMLARDGEGATKLLIAQVSGAIDEEMAKKTAKSVICSSLFKAAMFGEDANWGRVLCAIGYAGVPVDVEKIDVAFSSEKGRVQVCEGGFGVHFSEDEASIVLSADEITVEVNLNLGDARAEAFGCDLTYDYVKINGDYRT